MVTPSGASTNRQSAASSAVKVAAVHSAPVLGLLFDATARVLECRPGRILSVMTRVPKRHGVLEWTLRSTRVEYDHGGRHSSNFRPTRTNPAGSASRLPVMSFARPRALAAAGRRGHGCRRWPAASCLPPGLMSGRHHVMQICHARAPTAGRRILMAGRRERAILTPTHRLRNPTRPDLAR